MQQRLRDLRYTYRKNMKIEDFRSRLSQTPGRSGREAVFRVARQEHPLVITRDGVPVIMSDKGYMWYQLAPEGEYFWLSAAFDPSGELLELYYDITAGNDFSDPENPRFLDMYLDIALTPSGEIIPLDREELDAALDSGVITAGEYDLALTHWRSLLDWLQDHRFEAIEYTRRAMKEIME